MSFDYLRTLKARARLWWFYRYHATRLDAIRIIVELES